jgi:acyl dehydratase
MKIAHFKTISELEAMTGKPVYESDWHQITQEQINKFADATGDHFWLHVDVERAAKESPYGCTIAHGHLTAALIAKFAQQSLTIDEKRNGLNYGSNKIRYLTPVKVGARLRGHAILTAFQALPNGAQLTWAVTVEIEGVEQPACVAETITRVFR